MRWCIFYDDGTTFSSEDGGPEAAPPSGVVVIATLEDGQEHPVTLHGKDGFFIWRDGAWWLSEAMGFWDHMLLSPGAKVVKFGRWVTHQRYDEVVTEATRWRG
jgi:hypothetical protein